MINALAERTDDCYSLRMEGHATGDEAVCAGCSGIAYALLGALENLGEHVRYHAHEAASGSLWVCAEGDGQVEAVFLMAVVGLMQIEKAHPELVKVKTGYQDGERRRNEAHLFDAARSEAL